MVSDKFKLALFFISFVFFAVPAHAEQVTIASLKAATDSSETYINGQVNRFLSQIENNPKKDSLRYELNFFMFQYYDYRFQLDSANRYLLNAEELLDTTWQTTPEFLEAKAFIAYQTHDFETSLTLYKSAISKAKSFNKTHLLSAFHRKLSVVHNTLKNRSEEIQNLKKAIFYADSANVQSEKASALINLGIAYYEAKLYEDAITTFQEANELSTAIENLNLSSMIKAYSYANLGNIFGELKQTDTSLILCDSALKYTKEADVHVLAYINNTIGNNYVETKNYNTALPYLKKSYEAFDQLYMVDAKIGSASQYALCLIELGQLAKAETICRETLPFALETRDFGGISNLSHNLTRIAQLSLNPDTASKYLKLTLDYKDSLKSYVQDERIALLKTEYDLLAKEHENEFLIEQNSLKDQSIRRGKTVNILSGLLVLLALVTTIIFYRNQTNLKRQKALLHEQNDQLQELNEGNQRLIALISHDVRGPLAAAEKGLEIALNSEVETKNRLVKRVHGSIHSLYGLVDSLLNWARTNEGLSGFFPQILNTRDEITETLKLYIHSIEHKNLHVTTKVDDNLEVFADRQMLQTMIRNLITNAIKYSPKGNAIIVSAKEQDKNTVLAVQDFGAGIEPNQIQEILAGEPKVTKGTDQEIGTGLGLSLVKTLIDKHNGLLSIESTPQKGTVVSLHFPNVKS